MSFAPPALQQHMQGCMAWLSQHVCSLKWASLRDACAFCHVGWHEQMHGCFYAANHFQDVKW